jgi:hypothetical protein
MSEVYSFRNEQFFEDYFLPIHQDIFQHAISLIPIKLNQIFFDIDEGNFKNKILTMDTLYMRCLVSVNCEGYKCMVN